ncbi:hypothetical protein BKA69DRAFT_1125588 [Paraphysoderma sedebokerense]|nr:hypothetical protein BKA69DRAFT_1125588 [Paraphysoderma sedebokerense]
MADHQQSELYRNLRNLSFAVILTILYISHYSDPNNLSTTSRKYRRSVTPPAPIEFASKQPAHCSTNDFKYFILPPVAHTETQNACESLELKVPDFSEIAVGKSLIVRPEIEGLLNENCVGIGNSVWIKSTEPESCAVLKIDDGGEISFAILPFEQCAIEKLPVLCKSPLDLKSILSGSSSTT